MYIELYGGYTHHFFLFFLSVYNVMASSARTYVAVLWRFQHPTANFLKCKTFSVFIAVSQTWKLPLFCSVKDPRSEFPTWISPPPLNLNFSRMGRQRSSRSVVQSVVCTCQARLRYMLTLMKAVDPVHPPSALRTILRTDCWASTVLKYAPWGGPLHLPPQLAIPLWIKADLHKPNIITHIWNCWWIVWTM